MGMRRELGTSIFAVSLPQNIHALSVFLEIKKGIREYAHYSCLKDHGLPFAPLILKLLLEGAQRITVQSAPEADLIL